MRELKLSSGTVQRNRSFLVKARLISQGDESSMSFSLEYDPKMLTLAPEIVIGNGVSEGSALSTTTREGKVGILVDSTNAYTKGSREVVTLKFKLAKDAKIGDTTSIKFGSVPTAQSVSSPMGVLLPTKYTNGVIKVK